MIEVKVCLVEELLVAVFVLAREGTRIGTRSHRTGFSARNNGGIVQPDLNVRGRGYFHSFEFGPPGFWGQGWFFLDTIRQSLSYSHTPVRSPYVGL